MRQQTVLNDLLPDPAIAAKLQQVRDQSKMWMLNDLIGAFKDLDVWLKNNGEKHSFDEYPAAEFRPCALPALLHVTHGGDAVPTRLVRTRT